jgi:hypothetical protein
VSTVPTTLVAVAGAVLTASQWNTNSAGPINWLLAPAICQARQAVIQSIPNGTSTDVTFDSEDVDSTGMHSTSSNTGRITAVYPGWYQISGGTSWAANATGLRATNYAVNAVVVSGSGTMLTATTAGATTRVVTRTMLVFLNVGDFITLQSFQTSGGGLNTAVTAAEQATFTAIWTSN